jgi:hypothetical protein
MEAIRQMAPWHFRTQLRAVTEADYGEAAQRDPNVRAARGTLRWTGSWRTAFVTIDPAPTAPPPFELAATTLERLDLMRMAGVDLAAEPAIIVGLWIALAICIKPQYARTEVEQALRREFTAGPTCGGKPGLLDPANFTFGQTVFLSPFIAAAQRVEGVASVRESTTPPATRRAPVSLQCSGSRSRASITTPAGPIAGFSSWHWMAGNERQHQPARRLLHRRNARDPGRDLEPTGPFLDRLSRRNACDLQSQHAVSALRPRTSGIGVADRA